GQTPTPMPQPDEGPTFASVIAGPKEQVLVPKDPNFSILIPKIGANAKIFPNIDPTSEAEFLPVLQEGIAHAKGTVFPGIDGNTYLFAHSTDNWWNVGRYNAVFYLLKDLGPGDEIVVFFEGRRFNYIVTDKKTVAPTDVTDLVQSHGGPQQLILQTCWPPGTTWERLLIIARLKSDVTQ
ncbi:MAG: sortase, partial [bacterium]|nr:sortase [bacterium]